MFPRSVMDEIEAPCRAFLWTGIALNKRKALTSWNEVVITEMMKWLKLKSKSCTWCEWLKWFSCITKDKSLVAKQRKMCLNALVYELWKERNQRIFKGEASPPDLVLMRII